MIANTRVKGADALRAFNTLRNQILFGFLLVMTVVLAIVGWLTYDSVSTLLTNNSETHIRQTAVQAGGQLNALIEQVDTFTLQIVTDSRVQELMLREASGRPAGFVERQALMPIVQRAQDFISGVQSVELFNLRYERLFPLGEKQLDQQVAPEWIRMADERKGALVWIGAVPDEDALLAIRSVRLMKQWFSPGGYLLVKIRKDYFAPLFMNPAAGMMVLADQRGALVTGNVKSVPDLSALLQSDRQTVVIDRQEYVMVKKPSAVTGWTLLILTPVARLDEGVRALRNALLVSAAAGAALFLALSFMLSTMITRPLRKLIRTMRSARLGVLKPASATSSNREINELNHTYNRMVNHINELIRAVYEKEILQSQTEIRALQAQINPHFLFNTLETLYSSLEEKGEEELADLVMAMARLFRYTISRPGDDEWVTLREELEQVERYLHIMQARLGSRLVWRIEADPAALAVRIPKLTVQPLVENAIQHGIEPKIGPGEIVIRAGFADDGSRLNVSVRDNGAGMTEERLAEIRERLQDGRLVSGKGKGLGLVNVHRRIRLHCGGDSGLLLSSKPGEGTVSGFTLPVEPPPVPSEPDVGAPVHGASVHGSSIHGAEAGGAPANPASPEAPADAAAARENGSKAEGGER